MTEVPVVLIAFNRPDLTRRVVDAVAAARPSTVFLLADGPRDGAADDVQKVAEVRDILDAAPWAGAVHRRYLEANLGCGPAVASGLDWVFSQVERAIILEDDCLPDPSFFPFCEELLERYVDDERVMHVSGSNWGADPSAYLGWSYGFGGFASVWGWATWRRAWAHYDRAMSDWPAFRDAGMVDGLLGPPSHRRLLRAEWDRIHGGGGTWDHQWQYTVLSRHGLAISPATNLVSNLGFRADATQTVEAGDLAEIPATPMAFPLRHPPVVSPTPGVERHFQRALAVHTGRAVNLVRRLVPSHSLRRRLKRALVAVGSLRRRLSPRA